MTPIRSAVTPISDLRRPRLARRAHGEVARIPARRNGTPRSTATRALALRCGGFGSTERLLAGLPEARAIARTRTECTVAAALPDRTG